MDEVQLWIERYRSSSDEEVHPLEGQGKAAEALLQELISIGNKSRLLHISNYEKIFTLARYRTHTVKGVTIAHRKGKPVLVQYDTTSGKLSLTILHEKDKEYDPDQYVTEVFYNRFTEQYESWVRSDEIVPTPGEPYPRRSASLVIIEQAMALIAIDEAS